MEKEKINKLIDYVQSSLYFCSEAYNEIWNITQTPTTKEEYDLISGPPFRFYGVTLQYCFIMEYTKLLAQYSINESENVASLYKLNKSINDCLGNKFATKFLENNRLLNELCKSDLCIKLKDLRNKKFGHSDSRYINNPWKIEGFTGEQIEEINNHINTFLKILNNCLIAFSDTNFDLHKDDRTANFIRYHAEYQKYYYRNYIRAHNEGFGLNHGRSMAEKTK